MNDTTPIDRNFCKRWETRREFRIDPELCFDPAEFGVDIIPDKLAKPFVELHHYAASYPASRMAVGMFRRTGPCATTTLVGACVFSVPMNQHAVPKYLKIPANEGAEIGRFVLTPEVGFNGESWFLARARKLLRVEKPTIRGLISYADPLERSTIDGTLCKRMHWGQIYMASNAALAGRSAARTIMLAPDGSVVSERSIAKIRSGDRGQAYATQQLIAQGAPERRRGEAPSDWVARALSNDLFRRIRHPGNLVYLFAIDSQIRRDFVSVPYRSFG